MSKKKDFIGLRSNPSTFTSLKIDTTERRPEKKKDHWDELDIKGPCKDPKILKQDYENFKGYLDIVENYAILRDIPPDVYEKAVKTIKKMLKHLKEGRGDKVYDAERYDEYYNHGGGYDD